MINFELNSELNISKIFIKNEINSFSEAMLFVKNLPYGRNLNRENHCLVLEEMKGTCSSKHALLKSLADENSHTEVKLMMGIFEMNGTNSPQVRSILNQNNLRFIPEAHTYLKINHQIFDCTSANSAPSDFVNNLFEEFEIESKQVNEFKVQYHQKYLKNWCAKNKLDFPSIWKIREECILSLSSNPI